MLAFARLRSINEPSMLLLGLLAMLSVLLGYLSWKYVEMPFRNKDSVSLKKIFSYGFIASIFFILIGLFGHFSKGFEIKFDKQIINLSKPLIGDSPECEKKNTVSGCKLGDYKSLPTIALLGDSHSGVLQQSLNDLSKANSKSLISFYGSWCAPLIDFGTDNLNKNPKCRDFINQSFNAVLNDKNIATIVLVAEWGNYTDGYRWGDLDVTFYTDKKSNSKSISENIESFYRAFERTITALSKKGKKVIIVESVPEYEADLPRYISKSMFINGQIPLHIKSKIVPYEKRNQYIRNVTGRLKNDKNIKIIKTYDLFCKSGDCQYIDKSNLFYVDGNHLSKFGAEILASEIFNHL